VGRPWSGDAPDRGQAIPVLVLVVGLVASLAVGVAMLGAQLMAAGRAATAADAAALAAALHGPAAAHALAAANDARLVAWEQGRDAAGNVMVTVTVESNGPLHATSAVARALAMP
jgi:hypothetical protein